MINKNLLPSYVYTAERCKRSLFLFVKEFWNTVNTNEYVHNWHVEYIADEVQKVLEKVIRNEEKEYDLIINVPPGTSKSTIVTRMASAWLWANDDSKTIISCTIDSKNASEFSSSTKDIIESEKYKLFYPHVKIRKDVSAKTFYQTENGGRRYSLTTRGSKTGKHADVIIDDDPMDYETAQSPQESKQCIEGFKALQTRKKDKAKVPYILVMQRLSSKDTTVHALKSLTNVKHICLPAELKHNNVQPPELIKNYVNGLLDVNRLNRNILEDMKRGLLDESKPMSDIAFEIQFNQTSISEEGLMYPNINIVELLPNKESLSFNFSFTDVADTGEDYLCTWFGEINNGRIYIYDAIYTQESSNITNEKIKTKIALHQTMINKMETNNQGSVYVTWLKQQGVNIDGYYSSGNKEEKIKAFSQFVGYVYFLKPYSQPYHTQEYESAISHLKTYPKQGKAEDGHDDAEDALTAMLKYLYTNYPQLFLLHE